MSMNKFMCIYFYILNFILIVYNLTSVVNILKYFNQTVKIEPN